MIIEQMIGSIEKITIKIFVNMEIFCSSHASFLKVNLQAILQKLKTDIIGVIIGNTNIKRINSAFAPKNSFNLIGTTATVLSIDSIAIENLVENRIKKKIHDMLNINGQRILMIQKFKVGLSENQSLKSAKIKIKNITIGSNIIDIKTTNRLTIIPLISLGIIRHHL
jgi:hypothetical protein